MVGFLLRSAGLGPHGHPSVPQQRHQGRQEQGGTQSRCRAEEGEKWTWLKPRPAGMNGSGSSRPLRSRGKNTRTAEQSRRPAGMKLINYLAVGPCGSEQPSRADLINPANFVLEDR